jgi:hypothetical protein
MGAALFAQDASVYPDCVSRSHMMHGFHIGSAWPVALRTAAAEYDLERLRDLCPCFAFALCSLDLPCAKSYNLPWPAPAGRASVPMR